MINDFGIILDSNDNYVYVAETDTERLRFIADVFGFRTIDKLDDEQRNISAEDLIDYLCTDETYGYGIDQEDMSKAEVLKMVNIRYAISLNSYQQWLSTTIAEDVSQETVADVMEHLDSLQGINIEEESSEDTPTATAFANIIGYTARFPRKSTILFPKKSRKIMHLRIPLESPGWNR